MKGQVVGHGIRVFDCRVVAACQQVGGGEGCGIIEAAIFVDEFQAVKGNAALIEPLKRGFATFRGASGHHADLDACVLPIRKGLASSGHGLEREQEIR